MAIGVNRKYARLPLDDRGSRTTTNVTIQQGSTAGGATGVAQWARPSDPETIPQAKIPVLDPSKLVNAPVTHNQVALASRSSIFTLPAVAATTLTAATANTPVTHDIPSLTGSDVTGFIQHSVVSGAARITFPQAGFISGNLEANVTIHSSSAGTSGNTGHFNVKIGLFSSSGSVKEYYRHSEVIHDPVTRDSIDPVSVPITFTPVDAGDYIRIIIAWESSNSGRTVNFEIPAHSASRREQLDIFFYEPESAEGGVTSPEAQALIAQWARTGDTSLIPTSKLPTIPADKLPSNIGGGGDDAYPWAEAGNTDPIPPNKLRSILDPTNSVDVLRDVATAGTVSSRILPANYATDYRFLLVAGHANSEFGILDTKYLASQATLRSETYNWTRSTRTLSGLIKGLYLYGIDSKLSYEETGWLRATETTFAPIVPTTSANDGFEGVDTTLERVNQFPFFGCRVFDPGTYQILPNIFYKDIAVGSNRVFRVHNEALTKTLRVTRDTQNGFSFDSYNQTGSASINEMRSALFLGFHNVDVITPANSPTTMTLPPGFRNTDLFIAVTKGATNSYWTVWTLKSKFPEYTPQLATGGGFTPGEPILYAALITIHGDLEIKAADVSVDESNLSNISGDTVQEALDSADDVFQTIAGTKNYAKVGNAAKIPLGDYATLGVTATLQALPSNQLIENHLYLGR